MARLERAIMNFAETDERLLWVVKLHTCGCFEVRSAPFVKSVFIKLLELDYSKSLCYILVKVTSWYLLTVTKLFVVSGEEIQPMYQHFLQS